MMLAVKSPSLQDVIIAVFPWPVTCHTKDLYHYNTGAGDTIVQGSLGSGAYIYFFSALLNCWIVCVSICNKWRLHIRDESQHTRDVCCCLLLSPPDTYDGHIVCPELWEHLLVSAGEQWVEWAAIMSAVWPDWPVHALMPLMATLCPGSSPGMPTPPRYQQIFPLDSAPWCLYLWLVMQIKVAASQ